MQNCRIFPNIEVLFYSTVIHLQSLGLYARQNLKRKCGSLKTSAILPQNMNTLRSILVAKSEVPNLGYICLSEGVHLRLAI